MQIALVLESWGHQVGLVLVSAGTNLHLRCLHVLKPFTSAPTHTGEHLNNAIHLLMYLAHLM